MKEKIQRFMIGRYGGNDAFSKFLLIVTLILTIWNNFSANIFLRSWTLLLLGYLFFRMFSRNIPQRQQENLKYLHLKNKITARFRKEKSYMAQRKTHHIYRCPNCKQKIRIPKGKGRICITCPKCKTEFTKTS